MTQSINIQNNYIYSFQEALDANYFLSEEQKKQVMLFCYFHKNDFPIQMHSHEFYEINIIAEGTGRHYIENNSYPITSGDFFIGKPKAAAFLRDMTEKTRKQDMSSFVISSQCNNCMAYQAKYKRKTATAK